MNHADCNERRTVFFCRSNAHKLELLFVILDTYVNRQRHAYRIRVLNCIQIDICYNAFQIIQYNKCVNVSFDLRMISSQTCLKKIIAQ